MNSDSFISDFSRICLECYMCPLRPTQSATLAREPGAFLPKVPPACRERSVVGGYHISSYPFLNRAREREMGMLEDQPKLDQLVRTCQQNGSCWSTIPSPPSVHAGNSWSSTHRTVLLFLLSGVCPIPKQTLYKSQIPHR